MTRNPSARMTIRGLNPGKCIGNSLHLRRLADYDSFLFIEWKQRVLDREMHQDPDRDRYTSDEEGTVVDKCRNYDKITSACYGRPYQPGTISERSDTFEDDLKARYRLSKLLRARQNDRMMCNLTRGMRMDHLTKEI